MYFPLNMWMAREIIKKKKLVFFVKDFQSYNLFLVCLRFFNLNDVYNFWVVLTSHNFTGLCLSLGVVCFMLYIRYMLYI